MATASNEGREPEVRWQPAPGLGGRSRYTSGFHCPQVGGVGEEASDKSLDTSTEEEPSPAGGGGAEAGLGGGPAADGSSSGGGGLPSGDKSDSFSCKEFLLFLGPGLLMSVAFLVSGVAQRAGSVASLRRAVRSVAWRMGSPPEGALPSSRAAAVLHLVGQGLPCLVGAVGTAFSVSLRPLLMCPEQDPGSLQASVQSGAWTGFALLWWFALVTLVCVSCARCLPLPPIQSLKQAWRTLGASPLPMEAGRSLPPLGPASL